MCIERAARRMLSRLMLVALGGCGSASSQSSLDGGVFQDSSAGLLDARQPGDGAAAADAGAGDAGTGPQTPTVSSWLGTNLDADLPYADVTYLMSGFDTGAAHLDANGYPVAGASGTSQTDLGFQLPSGTYGISFVGTGSVTVSGIGALVGPWQTVAGEQRNLVQITGTPGNFGQFLTLKVTNTASQTVTGVHLYLPGIDYDTPVPFNPQFLAALKPFRAMRFMGWQATNGSTLADWSARPVSSHFGASPFGVPYELMAELINETGKDAWINVARKVAQSLTGATNEPIKHLAQFDARMYQVYGQYLTFWTQHFRPSLFMNFTLAGTPGTPENIFQYGFWGALPGLAENLATCGKSLPTLLGTETVASVTQYCPKYQALADQVPQ